MRAPTRYKCSLEQVSIHIRVDSDWKEYGNEMISLLEPLARCKLEYADENSTHTTLYPCNLQM